MIARQSFYPRVPESIGRLFGAQGLSLLGVAEAKPYPLLRAAFEQWLENGYLGEMDYLRRHGPLKFDPQKILPGCRSILFAGINYYQPLPPPQLRELPVRQGRIARYAWGRDYHRVLGKKLRRIARLLAERYPQERFRSFTDATPLAERFYAEQAGLGFTGKNTLLISSQYGSWFLIGEILSTRFFPPSGRAGEKHGQCPPGCKRCLDICPTGALLSPHQIDASRCISYLTIEHKGIIPAALRPRLGAWLFGCDLCQEVCPLNVRAQITTEQGFLRIRSGAFQDLEKILTLERDEEFVRRFAGTPLMRPGRAGLIRNACIVAANLQARELLPLLRRLAGDRDPVIAEHARWAVDRLTGNPEPERL